MTPDQALGVVLGRALDLVRDLADRWERAGARAVWFEVDQWPDLLPLTGAPEPDADDLHRYPLDLNEFTGWCCAVGEMNRGDEDLALDVSLACRLARYEHDIAQFTKSIIESNDQLLALYEMASSRASILTPDELATDTAAEAMSMTRSAAALVAGPGGEFGFAGDDDLRSMLHDAVDQLGESTDTLVLRKQSDQLVDVIARRMDHVDGAVVLAGKPGKRVKTPTVRLIEAVADRTEMLFHLEAMHATEVKRAVLDRDAAAASELSAAALPDRMPERDGLDIKARIIPARLGGGDFYMVVDTDDGVAFSAGDVSGKGLAAGVVMTLLCSTVRNAVRRRNWTNAGELMAEIDVDVRDYLESAGMFVTMSVGLWTEGSDKIELANAGHSPVLLRTGDTVESIPANSPPVGVLPADSGEHHVIEFAPGTVLMIGSDGLAEQENEAGEQLGYDVLESLMTGEPEEIIDNLFGAVHDHGLGVDRSDDQMALVLGRAA